MIKKHAFKGWTLELDTEQCFPNDPGQGTPALVVSPDDLTGTYFCVTDTGEIDGCEPVPENVLQWLEGLRDTVEDFLAANMV